MNATARNNNGSTTTQKPKQRDARGRFLKGNNGGPGNPFARKVAQLRTALVNFVTEDDMKHIALVLKERAMSGNLEAIKLVFQYVLGRPAETVDPDRLDVDEWEKLQESALEPHLPSELVQRCPADFACEVVREDWPDHVKDNWDEACDRAEEEARKRIEEEIDEMLEEAMTPAEEAKEPESVEAPNAKAACEAAPSKNGNSTVDQPFTGLLELIQRKVREQVRRRCPLPNGS